METKKFEFVDNSCLELNTKAQVHLADGYWAQGVGEHLYDNHKTYSLSPTEGIKEIGDAYDAHKDWVFIIIEDYELIIIVRTSDV